jgi:hypothetical protein
MPGVSWLSQLAAGTGVYTWLSLPPAVTGIYTWLSLLAAGTGVYTAFESTQKYNFSIVLYKFHTTLFTTRRGKNVMNACGNFYSVVWLINLKDRGTSNTIQIKHLRSVPRDSVTG